MSTSVFGTPFDAEKLFAGQMPDRVARRLTDFEFEYIPRPIYSDYICELNNREEGLSGKKSTSTSSSSWTNNRILTNPVMVEDAIIFLSRCKIPERSKESEMETTEDSEESENEPDGPPEEKEERTVIITNWGIDILNFQYREAIIPIPKPKIPSPLERPVHCIHSRDMYRPYKNTYRYGSILNTIAATDNITKQESYKKASEMAKMRDEISRKSCLRYKKKFLASESTIIARGVSFRARGQLDVTMGWSKELEFGEPAMTGDISDFAFHASELQPVSFSKDHTFNPLEPKFSTIIAKAQTISPAELESFDIPPRPAPVAVAAPAQRESLLKSSLTSELVKTNSIKGKPVLPSKDQVDYQFLTTSTENEDIATTEVITVKVPVKDEKQEFIRKGTASNQSPKNSVLSTSTTPISSNAFVSAAISSPSPKGSIVNSIESSPKNADSTAEDEEWLLEQKKNMFGSWRPAEEIAAVASQTIQTVEILKSPVREITGKRSSKTSPVRNSLEPERPLSRLEKLMEKNQTEGLPNGISISKIETTEEVLDVSTVVEISNVTSPSSRKDRLNDLIGHTEVTEAELPKPTAEPLSTSKPESIPISEPLISPKPEKRSRLEQMMLENASSSALPASSSAVPASLPVEEDQSLKPQTILADAYSGPRATSTSNPAPIIVEKQNEILDQDLRKTQPAPKSVSIESIPASLPAESTEKKKKGFFASVASSLKKSKSNLKLDQEKENSSIEHTEPALKKSTSQSSFGMLRKSSVKVHPAESRASKESFKKNSETSLHEPKMAVAVVQEVHFNEIIDQRESNVSLPAVAANFIPLKDSEKKATVHETAKPAIDTSPEPFFMATQIAVEEEVKPKVGVRAGRFMNAMDMAYVQPAAEQVTTVVPAAATLPSIPPNNSMLSLPSEMKASSINLNVGGPAGDRRPSHTGSMISCSEADSEKWLVNPQKVVWKEHKCEVKVTDFELHCFELGKTKPYKPYLPISIRRIVCVGAEKGANVVINCVIPRKAEKDGGELKKITLTFSDDAAAHLWRDHMLNLAFAGMYDASISREILVLTDKSDKESQKLVEKYMVEVFEVSKRPCHVVSVQYNEFSVANLLDKQDFKKLGNIIVTNPDFMSRLQQVLVRGNHDSSPQNLVCGKDPVDAALDIIRSAIGKKKLEVLHVTGLQLKREDKGVFSIFKK